MNIEQKRAAVKGAYSGINRPKSSSDKWSAKVDKMSDAQVTAIYLRLKNQGKL